MPGAAIMTGAAKDMLTERRRHARAGLVFPSETGARIGQISQTFAKAVKARGLNDDVADSRQYECLSLFRIGFM